MASPRHQDVVTSHIGGGDAGSPASSLQVSTVPNMNGADLSPITKSHWYSNYFGRLDERSNFWKKKRTYLPHQRKNSMHGVSTKQKAVMAANPVLKS
ncbi:hypothetical protein EB796_015877 [Bugula neritina]|uniref:Uncharacterized protein n=1 Tax=Bugula neritina TaxID=10212 RepID=A0A7J7JJ19_BUGNE|nr:hypothetical protein EB796_015877 [Bugula neritina]